MFETTNKDFRWEWLALSKVCGWLQAVTHPPERQQQSILAGGGSFADDNIRLRIKLLRFLHESEQGVPLFVLHLGDFIYEVLEYPDEVPHCYSRTVYDPGRIPDGRMVGNFHAPTNLAGYRHVYRAHIDDPDIQNARAHFSFVCIGDNHEFSWQGWQKFIEYGGKIEPAQPLRVAANQAWWEYIPSRVRKASGSGLDQFGPPAVAVKVAPIDT